MPNSPTPAQKTPDNNGEHHDDGQARGQAQAEGVLATPNGTRGWLLPTGLGALALVLMAGAAVLWVDLANEQVVATESSNRMKQAQADNAQLRASILVDAVAAGRVQVRLDQALAAAVADRAEVDSVKASDAVLQHSLDASRILATDYQTRMEDAKVDSLKHEGEVAQARAQMEVLRTRLDVAKQDLADMTRQRDALREPLASAQAPHAGSLSARVETPSR